MIFIWFGIPSIAKNYKNVKWLIGVFHIEKLIYALDSNGWQTIWLLMHLKKKTWLAYFFSVYGLNDWLFFTFFYRICSILYKQKSI
jgi:hypothetical protein